MPLSAQGIAEVPEVPTEAPASPDWRDSAACRHAGVEMVPEAEERGKPDVDAALAVCARCPVTEACLAEALSFGVGLYGVWGGMTRPERAELLKGRVAPPQREATSEPVLQREPEPGMGERLRAARQGADLSQGQLARLVGVNTSTVSRMESQGRSLSRANGTVSRLAHALGVDPEELLYDSELPVQRV